MTLMTDLRSYLTNRLNHQTSLDLSVDIQRSASVALILRPQKNSEELELGYIQRAENPYDPWSGHVAFPGGVREATDTTNLDAAIRETLEETGIELFHSEELARLDDIQGRKSGHLLDFYIRAHVFLKVDHVNLLLDETEVADFRWIPLTDLLDPARKTVFNDYPAIDLGFKIPLWGLSYLITENLLTRLSR